MTGLLHATLLAVFLSLPGPDMEFTLWDGSVCRARVPFSVGSQFGVTIPLVVDFQNAGESKVIRAEFFNHGSVNSSASTVFAVPEGGSVRRFLYLPSMTTSYYSMQLKLFDHERNRLLEERHISTIPTVAPKEMVVLTVSEDAPPSIASNLCSGMSLNFSSIEPSLLPGRWTGLTGVDLVVVPHETWTSPRMNRDPLLDWVAMGGTCLIVDTPEGAEEELIRALSEKVPFFGAGNKKLDVGARIEIQAGMGRILLVEEQDLGRSSFFRGRPGRNADDHKVERGAYFSSPPAAAGGLPFFVVLLFLVAFAVLAGPVGWWYTVNKKKAPLLFFLVTPAMSLGVIVIIVTVDLFKHGVTPTTTLAAIEYVDQRTQTRITLSFFRLFCPFTAGHTLQGDLNEQPYFFPRSGNKKDVGFNTVALADGVVHGDTLSAREPCEYGFDRITSERRRLEVWKEADEIVVENHLGATLHQLVVCCEGSYALFDRVEEGERQSAGPAGFKSVRKVYMISVHPLRNMYPLYRKIQQGLTDRWLDDFAQGRNCYAALRAGDLGDLIWIEDTRVKSGMAAVWGVY